MNWAPAPVWSMLAGAGLALAALLWMFGGVGSGRVHPVLVIYLLCVVLFAACALHVRTRLAKAKS